MDVNDCPRINLDELAEKIRGEITLPEFLFYRSEIEDGGGFWEDRECWRVHCSACGMDALVDKEKYPKGKDLIICPRCGETVKPRKWKSRKELQKQKFSYQHFQRGRWREVWARGFRVWRGYDGGFEFFEYQRICYMDGAALRWTRKGWIVDENGRLAHDEWRQRKQVKMIRWQSNFGTYTNFIGGIDRETIQNTCLEYSQLDEAIGKVSDPLEYAALYCKYPVCEYIWKMGLGFLFMMREQDKRGFQRAVNLKAKKPTERSDGGSRQGTTRAAGKALPGKLLKGLEKADIRVLRDESFSFGTLDTYRELRQRGALKPCHDDFEFADIASTARGDIRQMCMDEPREMQKYFKRQQKKSGLALGYLLLDYGDYLHQLQQVGGGELLPDDLREAHIRLSARIKHIADSEKNVRFRVRRRLLKQYKWRKNGLLIRPVDSQNEIIREGELQHNCVAGYAERHINGETAIFVLRKLDKPGQPFCTVEFKEKSKTVVQCRGYRNSDAPEDAKEFIKLWLERMLKGA